jgi:hypothetical protein
MSLFFFFTRKLYANRTLPFVFQLMMFIVLMMNPYVSLLGLDSFLECEGNLVTCIC